MRAYGGEPTVGFCYSFNSDPDRELFWEACACDVVAKVGAHLRFCQLLCTYTVGYTHYRSVASGFGMIMSMLRDCVSPLSLSTTLRIRALTACEQRVALPSFRRCRGTLMLL
eukprot:3471131-Amphidinium_carterae.1